MHFCQGQEITSPPTLRWLAIQSNSKPNSQVTMKMHTIENIAHWGRKLRSDSFLSIRLDFVTQSHNTILAHSSFNGWILKCLCYIYFSKIA